MGELGSINDYCTKLSTNNDIIYTTNSGNYSILTTDSCSTTWSAYWSDIANNAVNTIDNKLHINVKSCKLFLNFTL